MCGGSLRSNDTKKNRYPATRNTVGIQSPFYLIGAKRRSGESAVRGVRLTVALFIRVDLVRLVVEIDEDWFVEGDVFRQGAAVFGGEIEVLAAELADADRLLRLLVGDGGVLPEFALAEERLLADLPDVGCGSIVIASAGGCQSAGSAGFLG